MDLIAYLDNRFQEKSLLGGRPGMPFSLWLDADAKACSSMMHIVLWFWRLVFIPWVMAGFLLMKLGLAHKPGPVIAEALAQNKVIKGKMARKIGMVQKEQA